MILFAFAVLNCRIVELFVAHDCSTYMNTRINLFLDHYYYMYFNSDNGKIFNSQQKLTCVTLVYCFLMI